MKRMILAALAVGLLGLGGCLEDVGMHILEEGVITILKWGPDSPGLSSFSDQDICKGVKYGNPDYIEEAESRGLMEVNCE